MAKRLFTRGFILRDAKVEITRRSVIPVPALTRMQIEEEFGDKVYGKFALPNNKFINGYVDRSLVACDLADSDPVALAEIQ